MMRWRAIGCIILGTVGVLLLLGFLSQQTLAGTTPPVNLSGPGSNARFPVIARAPNGTLCAAWSDERDRAWNIYSTCSANNGQSWGPPGRVHSSAQESIHPALLFSGTVPVLAWTDETSPTAFTIYQKTDVSTPVVAVPNIQQPVPRPSTALGSNGELHLVFVDYRPGTRLGDVRYTRRPVGSEDWAPATVIFTSTFGSMDPRIAAIPSGALHVVWREGVGILLNEIQYITGTVHAGGGVTWSPSVTASNVVSLAWQPDVALTSNGDAHIVWTEESDKNIFLAYTRFSAAGGRIPPRRLGGPFRLDKEPHLAAVVAAEGTRVCIAWNAIPGEGAEDIFLICSKDGGDTWSPPENISRTSDRSSRPSIAVAPDGSVHIVWQEFVGGAVDDSQVYYTRRLPFSVYLPLVMRNAR